MILPRLLVGLDEAFELEITWFLDLFDSLVLISRFPNSNFRSISLILAWIGLHDPITVQKY